MDDHLLIELLREQAAAARQLAESQAVHTAELQHLYAQREQVRALLDDHNDLRAREVKALERRAESAATWARIPAGVLALANTLAGSKPGIALLLLLAGLAGVWVIGNVSTVGWDRTLQAVEAVRCTP